jgi:hypothetical protein
MLPCLIRSSATGAEPRKVQWFSAPGASGQGFAESRGLHRSSPTVLRCASTLRASHGGSLPAGNRDRSRFATLYSIRPKDRRAIHAQLFRDVATASESGLRLRQELPQVNRQV